ncbi:hypothetical protein M5689_000337 [Euphorbia peplus]|nr:hypothetical protein M5689_000337 [Euphorbia peplus]
MEGFIPNVIYVLKKKRPFKSYATFSGRSSHRSYHRLAIGGALVVDPESSRSPLIQNTSQFPQKQPEAGGFEEEFRYGVDFLPIKSENENEERIDAFMVDGSKSGDHLVPKAAKTRFFRSRTSKKHHSI